ncbi:MAG: hypothetical protein ABSG75_02475 [Syntrophales bacterium]|jgi:hypothetical protein
MKMLSPRDVILFMAGIFLLLLPAVTRAQSGGPPPIEQQLVREGEFAVRLASALGISATADEVEAESLLGGAGITPRNGWIADYPMTPDIVGELQKAVGDAADANKLSVGKDEAIKRLYDVAAASGLPISPYAGGGAYGAESSGSQNYPNPQDINSYYYDQGPPVVTYYYPPPDFYYLYAWIPYPFWCSGFWFPGFFVLHDFHSIIVVNNRVVFVSNHFNDVRKHRVFRIDPEARFNGRTFAGIGVRNKKGFISTGVPHSETRIFHAPREHMSPGARMVSPTLRGSSMTGAPTGAQPASPPAGGAAVSSPAGERRMMSPAPLEGGAPVPHVYEGEQFHAPTPEGRMPGPPPSEGRVFGPPAHEGETMHPSAGGGMRR